MVGHQDSWTWWGFTPWLVVCLLCVSSSKEERVIVSPLSLLIGHTHTIPKEGYAHNPVTSRSPHPQILFWHGWVILNNSWWWQHKHPLQSNSLYTLPAEDGLIWPEQFYYFLNDYVCGWVYTYAYECICYQRSEVSGPLELELLVQMWVLRIKLGCSNSTCS